MRGHRIPFRILFAVILSGMLLTTHAQVEVKRAVQLMGGRFEITLLARADSIANRYIDTIVAEIARIERLISDWQPTSQVSEINRNAGIRPVLVDRELIDLTNRALHFSRITNGAFDISFAAMEKVWRFDGTMDTLPSEELIKRSVANVGYKHIVVDTVHSTIFLEKKGMKIGFGALGEGYAADYCRRLMRSKGIKGGVVNATGDISAWGHPIGQSAWQFGIAHPRHRRQTLGIISLTDGAVTTSGNYEKFAEINGVRYSHIINPATGYPATGLISVTIVGPDAETANALSTSIMVLGEKKGRELLQQFPQYYFLLVTEKERVKKSRQLKVKKWRRRL